MTKTTAVQCIPFGSATMDSRVAPVPFMPGVGRVDVSPMNANGPAVLLLSGEELAEAVNVTALYEFMLTGTGHGMTRAVPVEAGLTTSVFPVDVLAR
jgi:hypothetical protein